ncbi:MAG TPA: hypothetical protein VJM32_03015 [Candidatus Saccharimonadales bacterium]|nr:hypothetical protein [Candidatus Saccharimonadales bacterium]
MRVPPWTVPALVVLLFTGGCAFGGNGDNNSSLPSPPATTVPATPEAPVEESPAEVEPSPSPAQPSPKTRSKNPTLPIIVPRNTVALTCIMPASLPKLADTNANEYPLTVFNAMCGAEKRAGLTGSYRFGQVGVGEGVECGKEYIIDGNETVGVAWWCPAHKLLLSSPAAILDHKDDQQKLLRELAVAYAYAYVETHNSSGFSLEKVACVIGRTILNLRITAMLSVGAANSLMDNFTAILESAKATTLSASLRNGYNDNGEC